MSLTTSAKSGSSFAPIEPGTYPAICYALIDCGMQYNETYKNSSPKVIIMWEIPSETITINDVEVSRTLSKTYTSSLSERATLRQDLQTWRGRDFTEAELEGFDLRKILGAPCLLNITRTERNGKTYSNIGAISSMIKGMPKPEGTLPPMTFDLDTDPLEMIDTFPEWIQKYIKQSETYKERTEIHSNTDGLDELSKYSNVEFLDIDDVEEELSF